MASDFDTEMTSLNAGFIDMFGEAITYTMAGAAGVSINAVVERGEIRRELVDDGESYKSFMTIHVKTSDVTTLTVSGDKATIDSAVWVVSSRLAEDAGLYSLEMMKEDEDEKHAPGFRRPD